MNEDIESTLVDGYPHSYTCHIIYLDIRVSVILLVIPWGRYAPNIY